MLFCENLRSEFSILLGGEGWWWKGIGLPSLVGSSKSLRINIFESQESQIQATWVPGACWAEKFQPVAPGWGRGCSQAQGPATNLVFRWARISLTALPVTNVLVGDCLGSWLFCHCYEDVLQHLCIIGSPSINNTWEAHLANITFIWAFLLNILIDEMGKECI